MTNRPRCGVHKVANITGAMPKPSHEKAKAGMQGIWMAETKKEAAEASDMFLKTYGVKYERAVKKLTKDRDVMLIFYNFPADHWKHIRTTNPIESVFETVRNQTHRTEGCLSRKTTSPMVFKLMLSAKKKCRKRGITDRLPEVIQGVEFKDGIKQLQNAA
jgi:putative transposase